MKALICLPSYNEIEGIRSCIQQLKSLNLDFIITDGGSNDGTIEAIESEGIIILHRPGKGKGKGFMLALQYARDNGYDFLAVADADMTYPFELFTTLIDACVNEDMVMGVRKMKDIQWHRRLVNYFFTFTGNILYNYKYKDIATGMRVLRVRKFIDKLSVEGFAVEIELCAIAALHKYRITQIPINYRDRKGKSKSSIWTVFSLFFWMVILKMKHALNNPKLKSCCE